MTMTTLNVKHNNDLWYGQAIVNDKFVLVCLEDGTTLHISTSDFNNNWVIL